MPASPIDWIAARLKVEGLESVEVTGRTLRLDYGLTRPREIPTVAARTRAERDRILAIKRFNSEDVALILNESGAEGISAHSHPDFKDTRPRWMVTAQAV